MGGAACNRDPGFPQVSPEGAGDEDSCSSSAPLSPSSSPRSMASGSVCPPGKCVCNSCGREIVDKYLLKVGEPRGRRGRALGAALGEPLPSRLPGGRRRRVLQEEGGAVDSPPVWPGALAPGWLVLQRPQLAEEPNPLNPRTPLETGSCLMGFPEPGCGPCSPRWTPTPACFREPLVGKRWQMPLLQCPLW